MATVATNPKQQAHELIDRLTTGQASAIVHLLEAMLDPVSVALAKAPLDDEPVSAEELRDMVQAHTDYMREESTSHEEVLREFGLMSEGGSSTPFEPESQAPGQ
jgi:hypothetical protein